MTWNKFRCSAPAIVHSFFFITFPKNKNFFVLALARNSGRRRGDVIMDKLGMATAMMRQKLFWMFKSVKWTQYFCWSLVQGYGSRTI